MKPKLGYRLAQYLAFKTLRGIEHFAMRTNLAGLIWRPIRVDETSGSTSSVQQKRTSSSTRSSTQEPTRGKLSEKCVHFPKIHQTLIRASCVSVQQASAPLFKAPPRSPHPHACGDVARKTTIALTDASKCNSLRYAVGDNSQFTGRSQ